MDLLLCYVQRRKSMKENIFFPNSFIFFVYVLKFFSKGLGFVAVVVG